MSGVNVGSMRGHCRSLQHGRAGAGTSQQRLAELTGAAEGYSWRRLEMLHHLGAGCNLDRDDAAVV